MISESSVCCIDAVSRYNADRVQYELYHMDPSDTYVQKNAKLIGSGSEGAQQTLQEQYTRVIIF